MTNKQAKGYNYKELTPAHQDAKVISIRCYLPIRTQCQTIHIVYLTTSAENDIKLTRGIFKRFSTVTTETPRALAGFAFFAEPWIRIAILITL